jgi:RNA methyltransferase, TrmH family
MTETGKTITSAANPAVKRLRSLQAKKYRDEEGLFIVEGARQVLEALEAGWRLDTLAFSARAAAEPQTRSVLAAAGKAKTLSLDVTDDLLSKITGKDNPQSLLGAFHPRWQELKGVTGGLWVGLEGIRDPGNLGTIIRSADAAGADGVMLIGECCDPWSPEAIRATVGSFARVRLARAAEAEFLGWKKSARFRIIGTHLKAAVDYRKADYTLPLVLLMGSEQNGLSERLAAACDARVKIPMTGGAESLNLAVSTGIMLYEICRDRL